MIASPSQILQAFFIEEGLGVMPSNVSAIWPIYYGFLPGTSSVPANAIATYDTVGLKDGRIISTGEVIEYPGLQVRVRSQLYADGYDRIWQLAKRLDTVNRRSIIVNGEGYMMYSVTRNGPPISLGLEENTNRVLFVVNGTITISGGIF